LLPKESASFNVKEFSTTKDRRSIVNTQRTRLIPTVFPSLHAHKRHISITFEPGSGKAEDEGEDIEDGFQDDIDDEQILAEIEKERMASRVSSLHPVDIVNELDKYIIGQTDAKKAVALALRNRWRRHQLPEKMRDEVIPKNILLVGPTGCGKTEIARRIAKLQKAPFVKVEATKYTEVGYHGKDVDTMISDLVEMAIHQTKTLLTEKIRDKLKKRVDGVLLKQLTGLKDSPNFRALLESGALENSLVEYQPKAKNALVAARDIISSAGMEAQKSPKAAAVFPIELFKQTPSKRRITIGEYRKILENEEAEKLLTSETIRKKAMEAVEQDGIIFLDEIDKICVRPDMTGRPSASDEGVQRDLLPLIEGTVVTTKYGNVDTSKILFICSGAFHSCKPSDLLPELQGRLPIRVELKGLTREDMLKILTQTENSLIKQQVELLKTEGITLNFTDEALYEISQLAGEINDTVENIGARRLHTIIEKLIEEPSFNSAQYANSVFNIDKAYVRKTLEAMLKKTDLTRFIL